MSEAEETLIDRVNDIRALLGKMLTVGVSQKTVMMAEQAADDLIAALREYDEKAR